MSSFSVGDAVVDSDGFVGRDRKQEGGAGRIAYMGPICLSKPSITWLGIVWESDMRGKNNGSLTDQNGVHVYFQCKPNCGSFVQPSKVQRCKTISEALQEK